MSEEWYYRFMDQDLGPVDFATLRDMGRTGTLSGNDLIRCTRDGEWRAANEVPGLFAESDAEAAFSEILDAVVHVESRLAQESNCAHQDQGWYCRILDQELGPYSFEDVFRMAEEGQLTQSDLLRRIDGTDWVAAGEIVGLISPDREADHSRIDVQGSVSHHLSPQRLGSTTAKSAAPESTREQPVLTASGDPVKDGAHDSPKRRMGDREAPGSSGWAGRLRRFVTGEEISEDEIVDLLLDSGQADQKRHEDQGGVSHHISPQRLGKPLRRDTALESPRPMAVANEVVDDACSTDPLSDSNLDADRSVASGATDVPLVADPVDRPAAIPSGHQSDRGGSRSVDLLRSLCQGVAGNRRLLLAGLGIVVAALLIVVVPRVAPDPAPGVYEETLAMWNEIESLRNSDAPDEEWKSFAQTTQPRVNALDEDLGEIANSRERLLQLMLYCHRDCLPAILNRGADADESVFDEMAAYMEEASEIYEEQHAG